MQVELTKNEMELVIKAVEELERKYHLIGCHHSLSAKLSRIYEARTPLPEDFTNRLDYARACYKAGVLPELRPCFKRAE